MLNFTGILPKNDMGTFDLLCSLFLEKVYMRLHENVLEISLKIVHCRI